VISEIGSITTHRHWWGATGPATSRPVGAHPDEMLLGTLAGVSVELTYSAYSIDAGERHILGVLS
jgi:hypothetical protein